MAIMKRLRAPGFWPIEKKTKKYTVSPKPGPHSQKKCLTLAVVIRDVLKYAETLKEVREILNTGTVKVDGITRKKPVFPVGVMDVISLGEESYRVLPNEHGFYLKSLDKKESGIKLRKIVDKSLVRKGRVQLNFHDGSNMIADGGYRTGDTVICDVNSRKIKDTIKMEKGTKVLVVGGNNVGLVGELKEISVIKSSKPNIATITSGKKTISLPSNYIMALGNDELAITVGEGNE